MPITHINMPQLIPQCKQQQPPHNEKNDYTLLGGNFDYHRKSKYYPGDIFENHTVHIHLTSTF